MKNIQFQIEDGVVFDGFIEENNTWNGWLQPYVTRETFLQIIAECITPVMHIPSEKESMLESFDGYDYVKGIPSADDKPDTESGLYFLNWGFCFEEA